MGNKRHLGEEGWEHNDYQARRNERAQAKIEKRNRKNTRKRKKSEGHDGS
ncbi:coil containing protein [Vibrio phage 1.152.O._10N.222.46.E1]|uniref:Coil containing protein n=5 Tax=Nahantvirus 49C7 TaxID=2846601 RepID=A0A2I7RBB6_9CAUD|nr:coil containing protein [Vibrio phage 1.026.O._10N.222.49.C7]AUR82526.1 coil containing protein [Vibrio phage 1.025.O._10N.222.46.B6]AUR90776.1 coil containing protein [Vibrio phage 1.150.O._10N.222.46.A6]AUR90949.1 coil containing protein [Vibrio phage 1.152.O._10N.222.46.E1]AUS02417.1 coil containing protein [Vibrio phage 2.130.O._10N.222.46.C2]AUR82634.1 coil containing protein [Vibrio phage 1.026.O._10N.222.49.C7]